MADINNINSEIDAWALAAPAPEAALVVMTSIAQVSLEWCKPLWLQQS